MLGHATVIVMLDVVRIQDLDGVRGEAEAPHRREFGLDDVEGLFGEDFVDRLLHAPGPPDDQMEEAVPRRHGIQLAQPPAPAHPLLRYGADAAATQREFGSYRVGDLRCPIREDGDVVMPGQMLQEVIVPQGAAECRRDR